MTTDVTFSMCADTQSMARELLAGCVNVPARIDDDETAAYAGDLAKRITAAARRWDEQRIAAKAPHLAASRAVDDAFRPLADALAKAKKQIGDAQTRFLVAKERRLQEEAEAHAQRIQQQALEAAARAEKEGRGAEAEDALEAALNAPTAPTHLGVIQRGDFGSTTSLRSAWGFEIEDFAALSDEYKIPNAQALTALAKNGRPSIPGVRWIEVRTAVTR